MQAVIAVVQQDLDKFDAVCMATALHTLASMRASAQQYAALFERPEVLRLMHVIGEFLSTSFEKGGDFPGCLTSLYCILVTCWEAPEAR
jgi:hypothetical protein